MCDLRGEIFFLLWDNDKFPATMKLTNSQIEDDLMDMLWQKLVLKCDALNLNIMPNFTQYLFCDLFDLICRQFATLMMPKRLKYVLNLNQLNRVDHAMHEIVSFFIERYNVLPELINENESLYKVNHLLTLQTAGSKTLINHHNTLRQDDDWKDLFEMDTEPFLGPKALWLIIKYRAKHHGHDQVMVQYFKSLNGFKRQFNDFRENFTRMLSRGDQEQTQRAVV